MKIEMFLMFAAFSCAFALPYFIY